MTKTVLGITENKIWSVTFCIIGCTGLVLASIVSTYAQSARDDALKLLRLALECPVEYTGVGAYITSRSVEIKKLEGDFKTLKIRITTTMRRHDRDENEIETLHTEEIDSANFQDVKAALASNDPPTVTFSCIKKSPCVTRFIKNERVNNTVVLVGGAAVFCSAQAAEDALVAINLLTAQ